MADDPLIRDLRFTIAAGLFNGGANGQPARRPGKGLMNVETAKVVAGGIIKRLEQAGYTVTDREGRKVIEGRPLREGKLHPDHSYDWK